MKRYQPALLGGVFIGVLSSLPVVNIANLCCCLWVIAGGLLTVYLQQQGRPDPLDTADAVLGGLIAGLVGAAIYAVVAFAMFSVTGTAIQDQIQRALESNPDVPPQLHDFLLRLTTGRNMALLAVAINVPIYAVFSMLGSLLGLAFFRKKTPPAAPTQPGPTPQG
jgi:hypothetical protein